MELYLAIALGVTLGEVGKRIIWAIEELMWKFKHRKHEPSFLSKWIENAEDDEELLIK